MKKPLHYNIHGYFECQCCHQNSIEAVYTGCEVTCAILEINPDKPSGQKVRYGKIQRDRGDGMRFRCASCGDQLRNGNLIPITSPSELLTYLQRPDSRYRPKPEQRPEPR